MMYQNKNSEYLALTKTWHSEDSPWKAKQIFNILKKNNIKFNSVAEVGCGFGEILNTLNNMLDNNNVIYTGFDIAEDAILEAKKKNTNNISFHLEDFTKVSSFYDVLLMIDVFEHVPDYLGFLEKCKSKAKYKIFHIPLDMHVSSLLRNKMAPGRYSIGHLHYFCKETALSTLEGTGHKIIDFCYTNGANELPNRLLKTKMANIPRNILYPFFPNLTVKVFGGYSLLVITE